MIRVRVARALDGRRQWSPRRRPIPDRPGADRKGPALLDAALLAAEEVYQDELREVAGRGEVGFARGHGRHLLDELDEVVVRGEHEGVDLDAGLAARLHLAEGRVHHDGVAAHRVLVEAAALVYLAEAARPAPPRARVAAAARCGRRRRRVVEEAGGGLAVSDHDDLLHLLALRLEESAREF